MAAIEVWEAQTNGRTWVQVTVDQSKGTTKMVSVVGKGSRLRISAEDRKIAQERTRDKKNDPFTNGLLLRVDDDQQKDPETASPSALSDEDLKKIFKMKQVSRYTAAMDDLSEVSLRRLVALSKEDDTLSVGMKEKMTEILNQKFGPNRGKERLDHLSAEELAERLPVMKLSG